VHPAGRDNTGLAIRSLISVAVSHYTMENAMHTILYVEDNEDNVELMKTWLELDGDIKLVVATDGKQGVQLASQIAPDLVLMDLYLPVMDGCEAIRLIRADSASRHIPIIALSAHAMSDDRTRAYAAGCDDFETKPIVFTQLLEKIRRLLAA
jgi:CheY-like chemotaxis protein